MTELRGWTTQVELALAIELAEAVEKLLAEDAAQRRNRQ